MHSTSQARRFLFENSALAYWVCEVGRAGGEASTGRSASGDDGTVAVVVVGA